MPATRPTKKPKRPRRARPSTTLSTARASLTSLPIEILAEVLLYTCSPPTVLAVSRTCSFLYRTLAQNPAVSFIWRGVRKTCKPFPLPDLGDHWNKTEAEYAALVFSGGVCEVCRRTTRAMYASFAVRIRLCGSWYCRKKFLSEFLVDVSTMFPRQDRHSLWAPFVESNQCFHLFAYPTSTWPHRDDILLRKTDLEKFQLDLVAYEAAERAQAKRKDTVTVASNPLSAEDEDRERIMERCNAAIQRFPAIMELSVQLTHWKVAYDKAYDRIKRSTQSLTKTLATVEGWDLEDLVASQAYGSFQKRKNFLLESIEMQNVVPMMPAIETELLAMQARRKRQKSEAAYKERLTEVKKIHERMRCGTLKSAQGGSDSSEPLILPTLSVFCTLPSVRVLKGSPDPSAVPPNSVSVSNDIKSSPLATSLILSDIHTWLIPVQTHLMRLLGYPNGWQSAGTGTLPPLKRVTARFFCRRCGEGNVGRGYQRELCLDLKGVCSHVCVAAQRQSIERPNQEGEIEVTDTENGQGLGESRGKKKSGVKTLDWVVDVFEKDEKAIRVIKAILELAPLFEQLPRAASILNARGGIIRCMTCKGWIVMDFDTAVGHAHRHECMEIELLPTPAPKQVMFMKNDLSANYTIPSGRLAFERGTSELLLGPSYRARHLCKKVNYGCKHCFMIKEGNVVVGIEKPVKGKGPRAMSFNGLRSHVKEKHGIQDIRDEDFFCYSPIQNDDGESCQE